MILDLLVIPAKAGIQGLCLFDLVLCGFASER